jgi:hypothetical protein
MKGKITLLVLGAVLLATLPSERARAGGGFYRPGGWHWAGVRCHRAWHHRCCACGVARSIYYYHPARNFAVAYYNSRRGVGRGYSTTAYSLDGYPHHYTK